MTTTIQTQSTPNPNALKFILNRVVKTEGKVSFSNANECAHIPLAASLFSIPHVSQVHFFDTVITVTQDGSGEWDSLEGQIKANIQGLSSDHDPLFEVKSSEEKKPLANSDDIQKIEAILEATIRPGLRGDGGDLEIVDFDPKKPLLSIRYEGACGSCPSATMGTLMAIQGILREQFHPEIEVVPV